MLSSVRREQILQTLERQTRVSVNELAAALSVSRETVRRDLADLDAEHRLRRVHGGAVSLQTGAEDAFSRRRDQHRAEKARIGAHAARLFHPGDSLLVDAGTTTAAFARALARTGGLTVVTNSVEVAAHLRASTGPNRVYLLGGTFNGEVAETLGADTVHQIGRFQTDHAVLTVGAVNAEGGFMDYDPEEATVAAAMVRQARRVTVLADRSKLDRTALVRVCGLERVSRLVTDAAPDLPLADALATAGVELLIAPPAGGGRSGS